MLRGSYLGRPSSSFAIGVATICSLPRWRYHNPISAFSAASSHSSVSLWFHGLAAGRLVPLAETARTFVSEGRVVGRMVSSSGILYQSVPDLLLWSAVCPPLLRKSVKDDRCILTIAKMPFRRTAVLSALQDRRSSLKLVRRSPDALAVENAIQIDNAVKQRSVRRTH